MQSWYILSATTAAGIGPAEALNLAASNSGSSSGGSSGGVASVERPAEDATDPELASWVEQLQQEVRAFGIKHCLYVRKV